MTRVNLLQPRQTIQFDTYVSLQVFPRNFRYGWVDLKVCQTFSGVLGLCTRKVYPWKMS